MERGKLIFWRGKTFDPQDVRELDDFHRAYKKFRIKQLDEEEIFHMLQNYYKLKMAKTYSTKTFPGASEEELTKKMKKSQRFFKNMIDNMEFHERQKMFNEEVAFQRDFPLETLLEKFKPSIKSEREKYKPRHFVPRPEEIHYVTPKELVETSSDEEE